jgi:hypothetical protein
MTTFPRLPENEFVRRSGGSEKRAIVHAADLVNEFQRTGKVKPAPVPTPPISRRWPLDLRSESAVGY